MNGIWFQGLRQGFPGGGNGPAPTDLNFGQGWQKWPKEVRDELEKLLRRDGVITFHAYQEMAGNLSKPHF